MRRDASRPPGGRSRWMPVCVLLTAALTACGTPPPMIDEEPGTASDPADAADATDGGAADEEPRSLALAPSCSDMPERSYQPPPDDQPPADPAQTTAEVILDLPVEEPAEPKIIELDDGEEIRIAPEAPQTMVGELQEAGPVEWPDHFGGVWGDQRYGSMVVGFTDDVERYAELVRERYGAAWWVVEVEHSERELLGLQEEIGRTEFDPSYGPGSVSTTSSGGPLNRVTLGVIEPSDDRLAELSERYGADRICFEIAPTPTGESWPPWAADDAEAEPRSVPIAGASLVDGDERQLSLSVFGCNADYDVEIEDTASEVTAAVTARNGTDDCLEDVVIDLASPLAGRPLIDALRDEEVVVHGGR
jgi:hypothetical protein